MKKNILIGVLSLLLALMTLFSFVKNTQAEEAEKEAIRCYQVAEEQMQMAKIERERAEMARLDELNAALTEGLRSAEKARELYESKE